MSDKVVVRLLLIVIAVVILFMLVNEYNKQKHAEQFVDKRDDDAEEESSEPFQEEQRPPFMGAQPGALEEALKASHVPETKHAKAAKNAAAAVAPAEPTDNEEYRAVDFNVAAKKPTQCYPQDETRIEDLLPKDAANSLWAQANPAGQGDVKDQNLLTAGYHIGVDTIGQSRKNPSYQIRSEPANPRVNVSIWNNSSIEYDANRRPFELGVC